MYGHTQSSNIQPGSIPAPENVLTTLNTTGPIGDGGIFFILKSRRRCDRIKKKEKVLCIH